MQILRVDVRAGFSVMGLGVSSVIPLLFPLEFSYCHHHHSEVEVALLLFKFYIGDARSIYSAIQFLSQRQLLLPISLMLLIFKRCIYK